ncbi:MAG TPA: hypothetical protein VGL97_19920 [Bryobacteraceae bacterium]
MTKHQFRVAYINLTTGRRQESVRKDPLPLPHELLLKSIENEINSGFMFVAVARSAYRSARRSDGDSALSKAESIHTQASRLTQTGKGANPELLVERLEELRLAIGRVRDGMY